MNSVAVVNKTSMHVDWKPACCNVESMNNVHLSILVKKFAIASSILLGYCLLLLSRSLFANPKSHRNYTAQVSGEVVSPLYGYFSGVSMYFKVHRALLLCLAVPDLFPC